MWCIVIHAEKGEKLFVDRMVKYQMKCEYAFIMRFVMV